MVSNLAQGNAISTLAGVGGCTRKLDTELVGISTGEVALVVVGAENTAGKSCNVEATVANCGAGVRVRPSAVVLDIRTVVCGALEK